uniref:Uncharacterized protein n=1 Tax=Arundo donax TaxID=35708 RepID=A0A0A9U4H2_ARUDO
MSEFLVKILYVIHFISFLWYMIVKFSSQSTISLTLKNKENVTFNDRM